MSEQEIDLDTAIELFRLVMDFEEYKEGLREVLTRCHTKEELDRAKVVIDEEKERLMNTNPEFKAVMKRRKQEAKMRADEGRAIHKAKMAEVTANANKIRSEAMMKAESARRDANARVDDWVSNTRIRKAPVEELENNTELWCPICRARDTNNNIINDVPSCAKCFHRLVPKSELKNYNRAYRRRLKKKRR